MENEKKNSLKPKKLKKEAKIALIIVLLTIICALLFMLFNMIRNNSATSELAEFNSYREDIPYVYASIDTQNIERRFINKETFVLFIGSADDPASDELVPILNETASNCGFSDVNIINVEGLDIAELNALTDMVTQYYSSEYEGSHFVTTPSILFVKDGTIIGANIGTVDGHNAYYRTLTEEERNMAVNNLTGLFGQIE